MRPRGAHVSAVCAKRAGAGPAVAPANRRLRRPLPSAIRIHRHAVDQRRRKADGYRPDGGIAQGPSDRHDVRGVLRQGPGPDARVCQASLAARRVHGGAYPLIMRIAFFSPLPPTKSGIADYSAAVLDHLTRLAEVETFTQKPAKFDASRYHAAVYQLGNNPYHTFAYEAAMEHPGVVVMHEANLHHLIADLTIRRGDWDGYLREVELNAGADALAYALQYVRTLERGPNYDIHMLRSILARSRAAIVHSGAVESELRSLGFCGPIARIPHGAWIADADRMAY